MKKFKMITALALATVFTLGALSGCKKKAVSSEDFYAIYTSEVASLNYLVTDKQIDNQATALFVDTLVQNDKFGTLVPAIAKEWKVSSNDLEWTFTLRDDVKWYTYDGKEYDKLTANDFVTAMKYILDPANASGTVDLVLEFVAGASEYYQSLKPGYEGAPVDFSTVGIKATGDYTLVYTMNQPTPFFPSLLTYACYMPLNEKFMNEVGANFGTGNDKIVYCGSYLFKSWERDKERVYVKNEKYYQADRVHIKQINYIMVEEPKVALEMFKRGEVSASAIYADQLQSVLDDPELSNYLFQTSRQGGCYFYTFNYGSTNTNCVTAALNQNFRKAIQASINRKTLLATTITVNQEDYMLNTYNDEGFAVTPTGKDYLDFDKLREISNTDPYNLENAKAFMATAKQELGNTVTWPVKIIFPQSSTETGIQSAALFKQMLEDAFPGDVVVELKPYASADYYKMIAAGEFDFGQVGWGPDYADPSSILNTLLAGYAWDQYFNLQLLPEHAEYTRLCEEAAKIYDPNARFAAYAKAEVYMLENCMILPYARQGGNYALNAINNPYDVPRAPYGVSGDLFLDRIYGEKPLTQEERAEQREQYNKDKAANASK